MINRSNGHLIVLDRYNRGLILANPQTLFAFGDNLARVGMGGQAGEARGCLNAIGIPTKVSPSQYIYDKDVEEDIERFKKPIVTAFAILRTHLRAGYNVVWPKDGVGTGLARLPELAPRLHKTILGLVDYALADEANTVSEQKLSDLTSNN